MEINELLADTVGNYIDPSNRI